MVSTDTGLHICSAAGEVNMEFAGRQVGSLVRETDGCLLTVVDGKEIWRRSCAAQWSHVATAPIAVQSLTSALGTIYAGGMDEASILRITPGGEPDRLHGFDHVDGRNTWFAGGPPLGIRSMTATCDGAVLLAGVHVGGVPISDNQGESWVPTMPVSYDVHEVRSHPSDPRLVAAAAAVGICISEDAGRNWRVFSEKLENAGFQEKTSLAVAVLEDEILFSVQQSPFAKRSQIWKWTIGSSHMEQVRDGLPEWLDGRVDTGGMAAAEGKAAIADCGGSLWISAEGSRGWQQIAQDLPYVWGTAISEV
jgi:hypothetical protein